MISGKNIIIAVSGSIAAYKSAFVVREFIKAGASVKVVMTPSAIDFITPLTLATLSKNPVHTDFVERKETGEWTNHVALGEWADFMIVCPATANTLSKMATGQCDNFLMAVYLSAKCPVFIAPAMDLDMYKHGSTSENLEKLISFGNEIIAPGSGELASGLHGKGRMAEPEEIYAHVAQYSRGAQPLAGKKVLVTAGPTYEKIDPVRFIGNHSSGKMGFALALALAEKGAQVHLIAGPTHLDMAHDNVKIERVQTAQEMYTATTALFDKMDIGILAAAVADYRPKNIADQKIKKKDTALQIDLEPTPDILAHLGTVKNEDQILIGFALETNNEVENARKKLVKKNLDFIVLNSLRDAGAGFGHDTNKISILDSNNKTTEFELKPKTEVAKDIVQYLAQKITQE